MKNKIKIGYELKTGLDIRIPLSHLVATGITQESGKTTTLEALIDRGECKAIIFKTKPGEKSITKGTTIMPFFKEDFDWEYASELFEDIPTKKTIICQCESCKRNIEIRLDEDDNIIGASCPDCHPHIKAS